MPAKTTNIIKRIVDMVLTVLLRFLMAFQVTGNKLHEWLGIAMTVTLILHHILNRKWYKAVFKGKYSPYRIAMTAVNTLMLAAIALTALSGMSMSGHAVPFMYTSADLNWQNKQSRSSVEMNDKSSRPELADTNAKITDYDTIFVGFPVWWYTAPTIINSFLESYDFSGKTIVLFATSGGSGINGTAKALKSSVAVDTKLIEGKVLNSGTSAASLKDWINGLEI